MPFKSEAQRKKCWIEWNKAKKSGKKSTWNCAKWQTKTREKKCGATCIDGHRCKRSINCPHHKTSLKSKR